MRRGLTIMRLTRYLIIAASVSQAGSAVAEAQAAAEDSVGNSTVLLSTPNSVGVNTADSSIQLNFGSLISARSLAYGFLVKGKAANGLASLVSDGEFQPAAEFGGTLGWKSSRNTFGVKAATQFTRLSLFDAAAAEPDKALTIPTKATGSIGALGNFVLGAEPRYFLAAGVTARRVNNWDTLKKMTVVQRTDTMPPSGVDRQETVKETEARTGTLEEGWTGALDADFIAQASALPISARVYVRLAVGGKDILRQHRVGFDVAFLKAGGDLLMDRLASVFVEFTDPVVSGEDVSWTVGLAVNVPLAIFNP